MTEAWVPNGRRAGALPVPRVAVYTLLVGCALLGGFGYWSQVMNSAVVPSLLGLSRDEVEATLEEVGLTLGATTQTFDPDAAAGTVIDQSPSARSEAASGTAVDVTFSRGPAERDLVFVVDYNEEEDTDWECGFTHSIWQITYPEAEIWDEDDAVVASIAGEWQEDPANGRYYPCRFVGTFPSVPTDRGEYSLILNPDDADDNMIGPFSRDEVEAADWTLVR